MQIYGIYVLYSNNQIYLELNRGMIIYGEKYWVLKMFWPLMQVQTSYLLKNIGRWSRWTGGRSIEVK